MAEDRISSQGIQRIQQQKVGVQQAAQQKLAQYAIAQEAAQVEFQEWGDLNAWNPLALARNFQTIDRRAREKTKPDETAKKEQAEEEPEIIPVERLEEIAESYHRKNPELQGRTLLSVRARLSPRDSVEDIIRKLREAYPDLSLLDEALDFLIESSDVEMRGLLEQAKTELYRSHEREIKAGRNMGVQARNFSAQGLGSPTALRDLYRNITGNPRDANTLFQELSTNYSYDKMKVVIDFMLHSLGADIKSKGPSISREELTRFMGETRNMQAILGIFRFFRSRMKMILSSFERQGVPLPPRMNFEFLSKIFMRYIQERYPSVEKALLLSHQLGISNEVLAQLIIYLQFRDAMRQVAPKLFRDERHRQELLMCLMETLEELEEELEEDKEDKKKK